MSYVNMVDITHRSQSEPTGLSRVAEEEITNGRFVRSLPLSFLACSRQLGDSTYAGKNVYASILRGTMCDLGRWAWWSHSRGKEAGELYHWREGRLCPDVQRPMR